MTKIIINTEYGAWCLSAKACRAYEAATGQEIDPFDTDNRTDPILADIVEELGAYAGEHASRLEVRELPKGTRYYIHEYDGAERIVTEDMHNWLIA